MNAIIFFSHSKADSFNPPACFITTWVTSLLLRRAFLAMNVLAGNTYCLKHSLFKILLLRICLVPWYLTSITSDEVRRSVVLFRFSVV